MSKNVFIKVKNRTTQKWKYDTFLKANLPDAVI